jgi:hypothetical protein
VHEAIDVVEPDARDDHLHFGAPVSRHQPLGELPLARGPGREVAVAAFRGRRHEVTAVVEEKRLAHAGSGGDERGVAARVGLAGLQDVQLFRVQHRH